jgi:hypothetical protein
VITSVLLACANYATIGGHMNDETILDEDILRDSFGNPIEYGMCLCEIDPKTGKITEVFKHGFYLTKENIKYLL